MTNDSFTLECTLYRTFYHDSRRIVVMTTLTRATDFSVNDIFKIRTPLLYINTKKIHKKTSQRHNKFSSLVKSQPPISNHGHENTRKKFFQGF